MTLSRPSRRSVAFVQAGYYGPSGLWPIFSLRSFEWITGPKVDGWLVKTVGALVSVVGGVLGLAAYRRRLTPEMELLAVGTALSLAAVDVVTVSRRRIRRIYLLDAAANFALVAAWLFGHRGEVEQG